MTMPEESVPTPSPGATAVLGAIAAALAEWRAAHPRATFAELEAAVEPQLARLRAQLLADALPGEAAAAADAARPSCPSCGGAMASRGRHSRTLRVLGDAPLTLVRAYWTCPRCGEGVFPPG